MPTWNQIEAEINGGALVDEVRKKYLAQFAAYTGRPTISYYSGWLSKKNKDGSLHPEAAISDLDMNGFMAVVHGLPHDRGVDLILHTPGGGIEAARSIVEYLYKKFGKDLRAIVPHMAMSAGTMVACATKVIYLAKHSCLGPTDPQVRGLPAMGVLAEVDRAISEIKAEPLKQIIWQQVFSKYPPAFILDCERSIEGAQAMVTDWLANNMLAGEANPTDAAKAVVAGLMDYKSTTEHGHHFLSDKCSEIGLKIGSVEEDQGFQEALLSVHHATMATFARTNAIKLIDNSNGVNWNVLVT